MAGKPEDNDVPISALSTDDEAAAERLPAKIIARRRRRQRRRQRRRDIRRQEVSNDTAAATQVVDSSSMKKFTNNDDNTTRDERLEGAAAETSAVASGQNSTNGHIDIEVPCHLQCDVSLFTFGEWVEIVKDNPHMIYYADDLNNSPLVPYHVVKQQIATTSDVQGPPSTDDDSYVTCVDAGEALPQVDGAYDVRMSRAERRAWFPSRLWRLRRLEEQDRVAREGLELKSHRETVRFNQWLLFGDDMVMFTKKRVFTKSPLQMKYNAVTQNRIERILRQQYPREHLQRSVGNKRMVDEMYGDAMDEHLAKARLRLRKAVSPITDPQVKNEMLGIAEVEWRLQGKYLGGMYRPTVFSCPESLWYTYMQGALKM